MSGPRGYLRFDRRFGTLGVARLQRSSGTRELAEFVRLNELLTDIASSEEAAPILQAFAAELISLEELSLALMKTGRAMLAERCVARLAERRAGTAVASLPAAATQVEVRRADERVDGHDVLRDILPEVASDRELVKLLFWPTTHRVIASLDVGEATRRRYATSMRALQSKLAAYALSEERFEALADLSEEDWRVIEAVRTRGMTAGELRSLKNMSTPLRAQYLRTHKIRIGTDLIERLGTIPYEQFDALGAGEFIVGARHVVALERLTVKERSELHDVAVRMGNEALVEDVVRITKGQWRLLAGSWGASAADWNHVRRGLSAVLTRLFHENSGHQVRQHVINCMPLLAEAARVPDISPAMLWRIMEHVPEYARKFPLCLVATGLRVGEYERLERRHLLPETFKIDVPGTKTDASGAVISVAPDCWEYVDGAVPSPFRYPWMRRVWRDACDAAGVSGITLHDLRHCHGQWAINEGAEEHAVQSQLRHKSIAMTRRYVKQKASKQSADAAGRALLNGKPTDG